MEESRIVQKTPNIFSLPNITLMDRNYNLIS